LIPNLPVFSRLNIHSFVFIFVLFGLKIDNPDNLNCVKLRFA